MTSVKEYNFETLQKINQNSQKTFFLSMLVPKMWRIIIFIEIMLYPHENNTFDYRPITEPTGPSETSMCGRKRLPVSLPVLIFL